MQRYERWLFALTGSLAVLYSGFVLGFVATSPDIRLRCLLVDEGQVKGEPSGVRIRSTDGMVCKGTSPKAGDMLVRIGDEPVRSFLDFTNALNQLRDARIPSGGRLDAGKDPSTLGDLIPSLCEVGDGERLVEIEFWRAGWKRSRKGSYLLIQSLPTGEIVLSLVWFLLQLCVLLVATLSYWNRPYDRAARLFYAMCLVTLCAFVGGFHWWIVAGSLLTNMPFAACAFFVPAVTLHFFLVYPRPKPLLFRRPGRLLAGLYAIPIVASSAIIIVHFCFLWLNRAQPAGDEVERILGVLQYLRHGVYAYFAVAAALFALTLAAIIDSYLKTRNAIEHGQVKWILWAAIAATLPVGYTLYLAQFDRVSFALGDARVPMFLASFSFMAAYAIGIVRYKLMLVDQVLSRGMLYYVVTGVLTAAFGLLIALSSFVPELFNNWLFPQQGIVVGSITVLSVLLLLWVRDVLQRTIDSRFFREKYRLDKALERMNRAAGHLVEPESLFERMLSSCRDVLGVEQSAAYLRGPGSGPFQLIRAEKLAAIPQQFVADEQSLQDLQHAGMWQRITLDTQDETSPVQNLISELQAELVCGLEVDGAISGLVVLGKKRNAATFTAEDFTFLHAMGQITGVALHSAKVHGDLTRLNEELRLKVQKISEQERRISMLQAEFTSNPHKDSVQETKETAAFRRDVIKGNSPAIVRVLETVRKVADSETSVLVRGESGTGKELLALILHDNSPRRDGPMVRVHCAALSPTLLESELFGHAKGAFTGAHRDKIGRFEMADGGTLFLDEIGDISFDTQVKLLRVLQERNFEPVGSTRTVHVDVRLVTATHQNLERLIADGRFREDLFYRLNVISITLPPLRERSEDILELALFFLSRAVARTEKTITHIDDAALEAMERYTWPGNVRELENVIERAVVLADGDRVLLCDLPTEVVAAKAIPEARFVETKPVADKIVTPVQPSTDSTLDPGTERDVLVDALRRAKGNKALAARLLGMPRSTYYSKLKKFRVEL
jgi:transcriptional regulator with GAF, ATPase, and Fis domain